MLPHVFEINSLQRLFMYLPLLQEIRKETVMMTNVVWMIFILMKIGVNKLFRLCVKKTHLVVTQKSPNYSLARIIETGYKIFLEQILYLYK